MDAVAGGAAKGTLLATLPGNRLPVYCLALTRDPLRRHKDGRAAAGWLLAAGGVGSDITLWDVVRAQIRARCTGSDFTVHALAFSPDGSLLASAGRHNPHLWDAASGQPLTPPYYHTRLDTTGKLAAIVIMPQNVGEPGRILFVELPGGIARDGPRFPTALGPAAEWWAERGSADVSYRGFGYGLYRRGSDGPLVRLSGGTRTTVGEPQFSADSRYFVYGGADGTVTVADIPEIQRRLAAVGLGWPPATAP